LQDLTLIFVIFAPLIELKLAENIDFVVMPVNTSRIVSKFLDSGWPGIYDAFLLRISVKNSSSIQYCYLTSAERRDIQRQVAIAAIKTNTAIQIISVVPSPPSGEIPNIRSMKSIKSPFRSV
jgi:hypothetical protein